MNPRRTPAERADNMSPDYVQEGHAEFSLASAIDELEQAVRRNERIDYDNVWNDWRRLENVLHALSGSEAA
jgi:hypothetical protein